MAFGNPSLAMPDRSRRRAGSYRMAGRRRSTYLTSRLGTQLREARRYASLRQADVAARAGVAQSHVSRMERGLGGSSSIETWASVAAAVGAELVTYLEEIPGATRPRDYEHLKRQQLVAAVAARGGWRARIEHALDPGRRPGPSLSVDVALERAATHEVAVVEIWDLLLDVGAACRSLDTKVALVRRSRGAGELHGAPSWRIEGLLVLRGTLRNRALLREFSGVFRSHFSASSRAWLEALTDRGRQLPSGSGLIWTDVAGARLYPWRP